MINDPVIDAAGITDDGKLSKIGKSELMSRANSESGSYRSVRTADQTMELDVPEPGTPGSPLKKLADEEMPTA